MTNLEGSEGQDPSAHHRPPIEIGITPNDPESAVFRKSPDGTYTIFLRGEIRLVIHPTAAQAAESPVADTETPTNGLLPDSTTDAVREPHSGADKRSWEQSLSDVGEMPESENRKFALVGNPARILGYRVTRKSNTRIADFVLATHPEEDTTDYWRIRAFGDQAEKVRDQVRKGQKGVEVTVYGPKYWKGRRKTKEGYEDTVVKGYHAGFVKVPKKYRSQEQPSGNAEPQQQN